VQTERAAEKTVRLEAPDAADPRHDGLQRFLYSGGLVSAPAIRMTAGAVEVGPMALHRWASQDVAFASAGRAVPLDVTRLEGGGVRVANTSGMALSELDVQWEGGWRRIAASLAPGASLELPTLPPPGTDPAAWREPGSSPEELAAAYARSNLYGAAGSFPRTTAPGELRVLARCAPGDLPRVSVRPAADVTREVSRCLWIFPAPISPGGTP
jgi:hypothetical protein